MNKFSLLPLCLTLGLWNHESLAYDNTVTHRDMTAAAVQYSIIQTDNYLVTYLGNFFNAGIDTEIHEQAIKEWIQNGSDFEDEDPNDTNTCRASNHFHNPIKGWQGGQILSWDQAQKTDDSLSIIATNIETHCRHFGWKPETRKSNLTWATEFLEPVADGAQKNDLEKQDWSWADARKHFYEALTLQGSGDRETAYADTFRAIGQVIHLIQDTAQPAHVRNDFQSHLVLTHVGFEPPLDWFGSPYEHYVKVHPTLVDKAHPIRPSIENASLTDFWDTNTYDGTVQLSGTSLGLAEHANANYFSEKTLPNNVKSWWQLNRAGQIREHLFPYPALNNDDYEICTVEVGADVFKTFVSRKSRGGCEADDHMAQISLLNTEANIGVPNIPNYNISKAYMTMDSAVYETYARELLPLAIGYSSALIDYFFRGYLGVIKKRNGLIIKNTSDEIMSAYMDEDNKNIGKLEIYYDRADGSRRLLAEHSLAQPLAAGEKTPLISFASPVDNMTPDRYIVVFKGKLGKEEGAVMAKIVSPKIYYLEQKMIDGQIVRKIMRMESDGQFKTVIWDNTDPNFLVRKIAISPDGETLAFGGFMIGSPYHIYTLDISGRRNAIPNRLTEGSLPDWSPDGNKLVFQKGKDELDGRSRAQVFSYDLKTGEETLLVGGSNRSDSYPAWSPDQNRIAYITNAASELPEPGLGEFECGNRNRSVELMDEAGNHMGHGTDCLKEFFVKPDDPGYGYPSRLDNLQQPVWSPDGNEIMFLGTFRFLNPNFTETGEESKYMEYRYQPFKININTQVETALFDIEEKDENKFRFTRVSSWSLDGKAIAVTRQVFNENKHLSLSKAHLILVDPATGDKIQDLTPLDPQGNQGSFDPDFGY